VLSTGAPPGGGSLAHHGRWQHEPTGTGLPTQQWALAFEPLDLMRTKSSDVVSSFVHGLVSLAAVW
jgi:hypothetical protein